LILLRNPKWGPIWWLAYYIPRLSRASLCVSWAFLFSVVPAYSCFFSSLVIFSFYPLCLVCSYGLLPDSNKWSIDWLITVNSELLPVNTITILLSFSLRWAINLSKDIFLQSRPQRATQCDVSKVALLPAFFSEKIKNYRAVVGSESILLSLITYLHPHNHPHHQISFDKPIIQ